MTNELVIAADEEYALSLANPSDVSDDEIAGLLAGLGLNQVVPAYVIKAGSKAGASGSFAMVSGGDETPKGSTLRFVVLGIAYSRGLWDHRKDDARKTPYCSAPLQLNRETGFGVWAGDCDRTPPGRDDLLNEPAKIDCDTCPHKVFGSMSQWTGQEGKKGPACQTRATLYIVQMASNGLLVDRLRAAKVPETEILKVNPEEQAWMADPKRPCTKANPHGIGRLELSSMSTAAINAIRQAAANSRDMNMSGLVFEATVKTSNDSNMVPSMDVKRVGIAPISVKTGMKNDVISVVKEALASHLSQANATTHIDNVGKASSDANTNIPF